MPPAALAPLAVALPPTLSTQDVTATLLVINGGNKVTDTPYIQQQ